MNLYPRHAESSGEDVEPVVEIISVDSLDTSAIAPLLWFGIDQPATSSRRYGYAFIASGWVLHPERSVDAVQVVSDQGAIVGWGRIGLDRPDLGAAFPALPRAARCGFQFAVGALSLPRELGCTIEAVFDDATRVPIARVRGRRTTVPGPDAAMLRPLLVSSLGRSGSTLLLATLAAHPAIVVHRIPPYETRTSTYWVHVFQVLSRPADHAHAGDLATFINDTHFVGQNPFDMGLRDEPDSLRTWYGHTQVERVGAFCRASIDSFYRTLAEANGQANPAYFAEKRLTNVLSHPLSDLYPRGAEIFLVRDFRDVVASIFAFNAHRGFQAFGRQHFGSDEDYIKRLAVWARQLHEAWKQRSQESLLVRYEDLILAPRQALVAVLEYLGLESDSDVVDNMIRSVQAAPEPPGHRTSVDAQHSIGRWRADLDGQLQHTCAVELGELLADFGYETEGNPKA